MYKFKTLALAALIGAVASMVNAQGWISNADASPVAFGLIKKDASATTATTQVALAGDPAAGQKVFRKCKACHSLKEGKNGAGPSLFGIMGAEIAQAEGFRYSKAMAGSGVTWTAETLAAYLSDPKGYIPGNKMAFRGLRKAADIENLIAYLAEAS